MLFLALLLAAMTPDVVDAIYFLLSICSPFGLYSHTVYAVVLEAALVGGAAFLITGSWRTGVLFAGIVLLHVPADFPTGHKLLFPGGELHGLDFYRSRWQDLLLEVPVIVAGWWLLRRSGQGPAWARSVWAVLVIVVPQLLFDLQTSPIKPSGCISPTDAPPPALVSAR